MEITSGCSKCAVPQIKWCPQKPKNRRAPGPLKPPRVAKVKKWNTKNPPQGWCVAFFLWPIRKYFVSCFVPFCILPLKMKRKAAWGAHINKTHRESETGARCRALLPLEIHFYWNLFREVVPRKQDLRQRPSARTSVDWNNFRGWRVVKSVPSIPVLKMAEILAI